jgi:OFA family oxalate/formate antiporter-like MFS transporter
MKRWPPLIGGVLLNLALGASYAWSVFVLPLEQAFGWSRQQTSWVFTIVVIVTLAAFVLGGRLQDTRGPRLCGVIGATFVGLGFSLASLTTSLAFLYTAFGCVVGVGNGIGYAAPMPMASQWFPDRRGLAVGLTVAGYGAGAALSGPLAATLIDQLGWRVTFRVLGLVLCAVGLTGAWLMKNPPPGFAVAGPGRRDVSTRAMVRTPTFYALWMAYCLGATAGLMTISQLVPFARGTGLSAMAATCALTVGAVGDVSGRELSGCPMRSVA